MAQTVTLTQLRDRARALADMRGSSFWSDTELTSLANVHIQDLDDKLVAASPPHYYATDTTLTTVAGTIASALPSAFTNLIGVYAQEGSATRLRKLYPIRPEERHMYDAPTGAYNVTLRYRPRLTLLSSGTDTYDGVAGWDEYVVSMMARDMLASEDNDVGPLDLKIQRLLSRIMAMAPRRDLSGPQFMAEDPEAYPLDNGRAYGATNPIAGYELRAGFLDLFQRSATIL